MSELLEIWDKYRPTFLIKVNHVSKTSFDLLTIAKHTCDLTNLDYSQVFITYDLCFIQFDRIFTSKLKVYLETYKLLVNNHCPQATSNTSDLIQFYGLYEGLVDTNSFNTKCIVATGNNINLVNKIEDIDFIEVHRAIKSSFKIVSILTPKTPSS